MTDTTAPGAGPAPGGRETAETIPETTASITGGRPGLEAFVRYFLRLGTLGFHCSTDCRSKR